MHAGGHLTECRAWFENRNLPSLMIFWRSTAACFSFAISRDERRKGDGRGGCSLVWSKAKAKRMRVKSLIRQDPQK